LSEPSSAWPKSISDYFQSVARLDRGSPVRLDRQENR
jgi:hypothetical protein